MMYGLNLPDPHGYNTKKHEDEPMLMRDLMGCGQAETIQLTTRLCNFLSQQPNMNEPERNYYYYNGIYIGSTSYVADANSIASQHLDYLPFGETFVEEILDAWRTPYRFTSKEFDEESGLYYYGARYYDPRLSVFLGVDPLSDNYPGLSPFTYCANNPIRLIDPKGMEPGNTDDPPPPTKTPTPIVKDNVNYTHGKIDEGSYNLPGPTITPKGRESNPAGQGVDGITGAAMNHGMPNMTATFDRQLAETYYWFKYLAIGKTTTQKMDIMLTYMSTGAPYDFKNRPSSPFHRDNMGEFGLYRGQKMAPDDFGNYNYGFAANALGLPEWFSVAIVGAFPNSVRTWWNVLGGFDQIEDTRMIRAGYNHK